ncbi:hypothetical protein [Pseudomonas mediterranea]|uniref:hypothetical protein n=1 Tax=Pseudomonas mediterranea TaxID=183795 RepID=UPI001DC287B0|nr:hypothetical protein [Pseudomonas mediterranea]CAH0152882.1 hypothetical protein SRABI112_00734 [Pseudomonas mediterranea]
MDFPKSVPSVGLVDGKFVDEDEVAGTPGSLIPAQWGNSVTDEILNVITSAGLTPDEDNDTQLLTAIIAKINGAIPASPADASTTVKGLVELATNAETQAGTDAVRAVTPAGLASRVASDTAVGLVELATSAETQAGTDTVRAVTPAGLASKVASDTAQGLVELATNAETQTGTDATRAVTPAGLASRTATESRAGVIAIATQGGVSAGTDDAAAVTSLKLATRLQSVVQLPYGFLSGFALSNNATTPNTVIDVGPGSCSSAAASVMISSSTTISGTLQSSGSWAAGSGQNKLDTGARAPGTWYHAFAIRKASDGSADILFSLSATAPTMPSGYAGFRRVGSFKTDSGGPITTFTMDVFSGRRVYRWGTPIMDVSAATLGTTASNYTMSAPPGVNVRVDLNTFAYANNAMVYFSCPDEANLLPANTAGWSGFTCGLGVVTGDATEGGGFQLSIKTNTSAQIRARANLTVTLSVLNLGWEE